MIKVNVRNKVISLCVSALMLFSCCCIMNETVYAGSAVNNENIISNVKNPENGVVKYSVKVPAGERIDYSVELTPDKKTGTIDKVTGSFTNKTKKTVTKVVTANVKFFSDKYKVSASYSKKTAGVEILYKDTDTVVSALKTTAVTSKVSWDFNKLGQGNKEWKYRYKYEPYKNGFKQYLQVFDKKGKQIQNYVNQIVSESTITKIINEMKK